MLYLILGRNGTDRTKRLHQYIDEMTKKAEAVLIVPEQCSFNNEKKLLKQLGAKRAAKIRVLSFRSLCRLIFETYHGFAKKTADDGTKAVLMSMAIGQCAPKLRLYTDSGKSLKKSMELIEPMLNAVNEYKCCDISPDQLLDASRCVNDKNLSDKLADSALIYEAYDSILGETYADPDDDLKKAADILRGKPFFKDKYVFVDSFYGFSALELNMLKIIMNQAEDVFISLCCDKAALKKSSCIFAEPNETYNCLREYCSSNNIEIKTEFSVYNGYYKSDALLAVEDGLFSSYRLTGEDVSRPEPVENNGSVALYEGTDIYDEVQYIAQRIFELVHNDHMKYSDIEIIGRDTDRYRPIFASEFPKYSIPYFLSSPEPLENKHLIKFIISAFTAVHSGFDTESILRMVKTRMAGLTLSETDLLEEYCYIWDIKGKRWRTPFTMDPAGNRSDNKADEKAKEKTKKDIEKIEDIRKKLIEPLTEFESSIKSAADGAEITVALYELMKKYNCKECFKKLISVLKRRIDKVSIEREMSVWDICMDILSRMHTVLKDRPMDSRSYLELLRIYLKSSPISDIPRTVNSVTVGTAGTVRSNDPKAVFAIGANEGVFPAKPFDVGIFTDSERRLLRGESSDGTKLPLRPSVIGNSLKEKMNVYMTLTAPSEKLFVTRHSRSTSGDSYDASVIFHEIKLLLSDTVPEKRKELTDPSLKNEEIFYTPKQSFELCARSWNSKGRLSDTMKTYFSTRTDYEYRVEAIKRAAERRKFSIEDHSRARKLFGKDMYLSSTKIETYYSCRFSYFCEYGLKIKSVKKTSFDHALFGTAMHFIFEKLLKDITIDSLKKLDDAKLAQVIKEQYDAFVENLGDAQERGGRFEAIGRRIRMHAFLVIKRMCRQFENDQFKPVDFELHIGGDKAENSTPAFKLSLPTGENIFVTGYVDRVDLYEDDSNTYIRIIDYKTKSEAKFNLGELTNGQMLQMFIYLYAILQNEEAEKKYNKKGELIPAGVLYVPSLGKSGGASAASERSQGNKKIDDSLKMKGLLLADKDILSKMEPELNGEFIPAVPIKDPKKSSESNAYDEFNAQSSWVATKEDFDTIFKYVRHKINAMATELYNGNIEVNPTKDACTFCEFSSVCRIENGIARRKLKTPDKKSVIKVMKAEMSDSGEEKKDE